MADSKQSEAKQSEAKQDAPDAKDKRIRELEVENARLRDLRSTSSVVKFSSSNGPRGYNLNALFRDRGTSKRPRLDEISNSQLQRIRGEDEMQLSPYTAYDAAKEVIRAAVIEDDSIRNLLIQALADGLNAHVPDPTKWEQVRLEWADKDDETYKSDHRAFTTGEPGNPNGEHKSA